MAAEATDPTISLYVHWPFCLAKCPYCDFNSHVRESIDHDRWAQALHGELEHFAAMTGGRRLVSIFFGGGTPSLMRPATVAALIDRAARAWRIDPAIEVTLEANPTSVEANKMADFAAAGVNRVSLGVQSLDDGALRFLGRGHTAAEAIEAVGIARKSVPRHSIDLIYARPGQTREAWRDEVGRALDLVDGHVSVYQLTIEKATPFQAALRRGELIVPDEDAATGLFDDTQEMLEAAGLPAYEISNHAAPGAECRHNLACWLGGEYIGIGPGAHGRVRSAEGWHATVQLRAPEAWLDAVGKRGHGTQRLEPLAPAQRLEELVMTGLRLNGGIPRRVFDDIAARPPEDAFDRSRLDRLIGGGFLALDETGLRATRRGRRRLNSVIGALIA